MKNKLTKKTLLSALLPVAVLGSTLSATLITTSCNKTKENDKQAQEKFLKAYDVFYQKYQKSKIFYGKMSFSFGSKIKGIPPENLIAKVESKEINGDWISTATFDTTPEATLQIAANKSQHLKEYFDTYSDDKYLKTFDIKDDSVTYTIKSRSDEHVFETITFNDETYVSNWVNTIVETGKPYNGTKLTGIKYSQKEKFAATVVSKNECSIGLTDYGRIQTGEIEIPSSMEINGKSHTVVSLSDSGFKSMLAQKVTFADSTKIKSIGISAFEDCENLLEISIPTNVISINYRTFANCPKLTNITIPAKVETISRQAFQGSGLTSATFEKTDDWKQTGGSGINVIVPAENAINLKNCGDTSNNWGKTGIEIKKTTTLTPNGTAFEDEGIKLSDVTAKSITTDDDSVSWALESPVATECRYNLNFDDGNAIVLTKEIRVNPSDTQITVKLDKDDWSNIPNNSNLTLAPTYIYKECPISVHSTFSGEFEYEAEIESKTIGEEDGKNTISFGVRAKRAVRGYIYLAAESSTTKHAYQEVDLAEGKTATITLTIPSNMWGGIGYGDTIWIAYEAY